MRRSGRYKKWEGGEGGSGREESWVSGSKGAGGRMDGKEGSRISKEVGRSK